MRLRARVKRPAAAVVLHDEQREHDARGDDP
jgi:hypothetical protein